MSETFSPGTQIGRFYLEAETGRGGMGVIYRGVDPVLNRLVAIKLLAPHLGNDPDALARFHREASLVASLKHSHIAIVYEFGEFKNRPYIAFEWIEGRTLKEILVEEGPLPLERGLKLFEQIASALDYAHHRGVIHRDLKPANIIVGPDDTTTIVDFGLAWLDSAPSITATGLVLGTPRYMSPEQIQGNTTDSRTDLYSLAIILYEMLAGQPPFNNPSTAALLHQTLFTPPPPITECNPTLPETVETTLEKALEKDPDKRFPSARMFMNALLSPSGTLELEAPHPQGKARSPARRVSWPRWVLPALLLVGITAIAIWIAASLLPARMPAATGTPSGEATVTRPPPTPFTQTDELSDTIFLRPLEDGFWAMSNGSPEQTRFVDGELFPIEPEPRWEFYPELEHGAELVGGNEVIVVAVEGGLVYGLDWATGDPLWQTRLGADISAPPVISPDWDEELLVLVPTRDGALYGLNLWDVRLAWRIGPEDLGETVVTGITLGYDDVAYAVTERGLLHAIDPFAGEIFASLDLSGEDNFYRPPTVTNVAIYLVGEFNRVYAIDKAQNDIAWSTETAGRVTTPAVAGDSWGFILTGTEEGWVQAFSMLTGAPVWEAHVDGPVTGMTHDWSGLYVTTEAGSVYAFDGETGETWWYLNLGAPIIVGPLTDGRLILVGTSKGTLHYLEIETGEENPDHVISALDEIQFSPTPVGGWLFLRTEAGVYGFAPSEIATDE
ncbi:MAG: protein kinase [Anaerolineales bacterium]